MSAKPLHPAARPQVGELLRLLGAHGVRFVLLGSVTTLANGEKKWIARPRSDEDVASWAPDPGDPATLDHLLRTWFGSFDKEAPRVARLREIQRERRR